MSRNSKTTSLAQNKLVDKLEEFASKMAVYEWKQYHADEHQTQPFIDKDGVCFGLCAYLAHCAITENNLTPQELAKSTKQDPKFITNPHTVDEFYKTLQYINSSKWPINPKEETAFYQKIQLFMNAIIQLQAGMGRRAQHQNTPQNMEYILNEATRAHNINPAPPEYARQNTHNYFFTQNNGLLEWVKKAQPGDILHLSTGDHSMMIYAIKDKDNTKKVKIGFYDPNEQHKIILDQDKIKGLSKDFRPFSYGSEFIEPYVVASHIVSSNNSRSPIHISNDTLTETQSLDILDLAFLKKDNQMIKSILAIIEKQKISLPPEQFDKIASNNELMETLCNSNTCLHIQDDFGNTLLHKSIELNNYKIFQMFLNKAPELLNIPNNSSKTPLHNSAMNDKDHYTELLVKSGASLNIQDKFGITPLHYATDNLNEKMVKLLLNHGAKIDIKDKQGLTALDYAKFSTEIEKILLDHQKKSQTIKPYKKILMERQIGTSNIQIQPATKQSYADMVRKKQPTNQNSPNITSH
jgi:hypothetical protein